MRKDKLIINKAEGLRDIKDMLRAILKQERTLALEAMDNVADYIYNEAFNLVPIETGELQDSIMVDVSRSPRYPGIIVSATARNPRTGFDYAYEQETNETYKHKHGQAHFLEEPFREAVQDFLMDSQLDWGEYVDDDSFTD